MSKARAVAADRDGDLDSRSRRKRRVIGQQEDFVRAFIDALRDILHDELRAAG